MLRVMLNVPFLFEGKSLSFVHFVQDDKNPFSDFVISFKF